MRAMARSDAGEATLVELKAVEDAWPRLGQAVFEPAIAPGAALARARRPLWRRGRRGAARPARPQARRRLRSRRGAHRIRAKLIFEPDRLAAGIGFSPRALISQDALSASGLIQPGSLVRWTTRVLLNAGGAPPDEAAVEAFVDDAKAAFPQAGWEARTRSNVSPDFSRDLDRFGEFLALTGLISLVVGGVGVANAAQGFVERKRATLAVLKALGASGGAVVALALIDFLAASLVGVVAGMAIGERRRSPSRRCSRPSCRCRSRRRSTPRELALGALYGVLTALCFAIAPLGRAHDIPVSQSFRNLVDTVRRALASALCRRNGARRRGAGRRGGHRQPAAHCRDRRRRRDGAGACRVAPRRAPARWRWRAGGARRSSPGAWRSPTCTGPAR